MPNALHYLLVTRLKEEVGIPEDNYLLWASLFPQALDVRDQRAKATNLGKRRYDQLLSDLAAEWRDDPDKAALVDCAARVATHAHRGAQVPADDLRRLLQTPEGADERAQLVDAVRQSVARTTIVLAGDPCPAVLGRALAAHASDPWISGVDDELGDYRGLGFLFSDEFKESFDAMVRREFDWQERQLFSRFWQEYRYLQDRYLQGTCSAAQEHDIIVALFSMCVLACLVGPGSFVEELGFDSPELLRTVVRMGGVGMAERRDVRYQLQPVVFNGLDARTYYTAGEPPIVFDAGDVVRFGRDGQWMSELPCKAVTFTDADVSRRHAELRHTPKGWEIVDIGDGTGSANGTLVFRAFGGPIFRKRGFSAQERAIKIQSGDIIYIAPLQGSSYDVELRRGRVLPELGKEHRAFRFERRG